MGPFCPTRLVSLMASRARGNTAILSPSGGRLVTLTVVGGGERERAFALRRLAPVLLECVRVLTTLTRQHDKVMHVHVTYCNACPARIFPPSPAMALTSEHVNGGVCMGETMGVLVFRRQDAEKVLIHELLHLFGVDAALREVPGLVEARVVGPRPGMWGVRVGSLPVHLSESYTDAVACLVFCGDRRRAAACAVERATRVMAHFKMGGTPFLESTHAFAYYIVKAAMLVHAEEFVALLHAMRTPLIPAKGAEVTRVVRFMEKCLRSVAFGEAVASSKATLVPGNGLSMTDGQGAAFAFSAVGVLI